MKTEFSAVDGQITGVHGPVLTIASQVSPPLRQALAVTKEKDRNVLEVHQHADENHLRAIVVHIANGLRCDLGVPDTGGPFSSGHTALPGNLQGVFREPLAGEPLCPPKNFATS
jgi:F-type H+-transporting ATPase subunit beta